MLTSFKVHGGWTTYGAWTRCTKSCGSGVKTRARNCTNPAPKYGGNDCYGDAVETARCNTDRCPGI